MDILNQNVITGAAIVLLGIVGILHQRGIIVLPGIKKGSKDMTQYVKKADLDRVEKQVEKCLTIDKHVDLCQISKLNVNQHVSKEMVGLKDAIFPALRLLARKINGGKEDLEMDNLLK